MKKFICILCCLVLFSSFLFSACDRKEGVSLTVSPKEIVLKIGESKNIVAESNFIEEVVFESNDNNIATVSENGVVTGISAGEAQISVSVRNMSEKVNVKVNEKQNSIEQISSTIDGDNVIFSFTIETNGLYCFELEEVSGVMSEIEDDVVYSFDNGYTTRLKSRTVKENNNVRIGTKFLRKGEHTFLFEKAKEHLNVSKLNFSKVQSYESESLSLAKNWMDVLYQETGYNTDKPNYLGYVETEGWDDIWTHCQYLPYSMYIAKTEDNNEYDRRVKKIADDLLIGKMLRSDGSVNTIYRADDDVFQVSIESNMPTNKYELWRGQAAFIEEMINCYLYTNNQKYLNYAKSAADYIIDNWSKTNISGIFGGIYTRYTSSSGGSIDIMSTGRAVMTFAQLYQITQESEYLSVAKQQAKVLLKAQEATYENVDGLFADSVESSGNLGEFRHGNAYANAMLGLAWMYKITEEDKYLEAIDKGIKVLEKVYDDEKGMVIVMDGRLIYQNSSTGAMYLAGRMAQAVMTCAAFVGEDSYYKEGERVIEFALGRNYGNRNVQNSSGAYHYGVENYGQSNVETSCEIYLALMQYYYLTEIWNFELK